MTYNAIIAASERGGRFDVCLACFQDMVDSDALPDSVAYCSAINACQKMGQWREAEKILSDMHGREFVASVGVYATMIEHYATHSCWESALDLFMTMQLLGQTVDVRCCDGLMMAFVSGQKPELAYHLLESMWTNDIKINASMCSAALRIITAASRWELAHDLVTALHCNGKDIAMETVLLVIQSMKSAGKEEMAMGLETIVKQLNTDS